MTKTKLTEAARQAKADRVKKVLTWLCENGQGGREVVVGCNECKNSSTMKASVALTSWLHSEEPCEPWIKNPMLKRKESI